MTATDFSEALFNAMSFSSILVLTALGLAITFGVMRVINMAHGDMLMLGAYTAYIVTDPHWLGLNIYLAIPIAFLVVGGVGYLLEVCLIRFLYGRPLDTLLATWGVSMIVQQTVLMVSRMYNADRPDMHMPDELQGSWPIAGVNIPIYRVFIVGVTALCLLAVYGWFYWTTF